MEPYFVIKGKINKEVLVSLKNNIFSRGNNRFVKAAMIFFGAFALLFFMAKALLAAGVFFAAAIIIPIEWILLRNYCVHKVLKPIKQAGLDELPYTLYFFDDSFTMKVGEESALEIRYEHILRIVEVQHYFVLFTKGGMCFPVLRDAFLDYEDYEWIDFMIEKNKRIILQNIGKTDE